MNITLECFDFQASVYDTYQNTCVPKYREMIATPAEFLADVMADRKGLRILDVGCGTGNSTKELTQRIPDAAISCLDGSEEMLQVARKKLRGFSVEFYRLDLEHKFWDRIWDDQTFDALLSVLVLEHLPFDVYREFLASAKRILKEDGRLVTVEAYKGDLNHELFFKRMRQLEDDAVGKDLVSREILDEMREVSKEKERHFFAPPDDKKNWWTEAGFHDVEFVWQYYCVGILVGRKPRSV